MSGRDFTRTIKYDENGNQQIWAMGAIEPINEYCLPTSF